MEEQSDDNVIIDQGNVRADLISSLFGHQISSSNPKPNPQNPINCPHPILIKNTCTKCNTTIINGSSTELSTIPFWYIYPNLSISRVEMNRLKGSNLRALLARRKLHLVLDLDHTLVHTRVSWKLSPEDRNFLRTKRHGFDYNLPEGGGSLYKMAGGWTKLRPYVRTFLRELSSIFEITVYTLGCRACAWATAKVLDPEGEYFGTWRVITREDCSGSGLDKHKKVLDVVVAHERGVLVVDDNENVWSDHKTSLVKIKPYNFFCHNSPDEDKLHDASPPRKSWSQLGGDESEERGELARVLEILREVHQGFFDGLQDEFEKRDVREVLQRVLKSQRVSKKQQGKKERRRKTSV